MESLDGSIKICHNYFFVGYPSHAYYVYKHEAEFPVLVEDVPRLLALKQLGKRAFAEPADGTPLGTVRRLVQFVVQQQNVQETELKSIIM